MPLKRAPFGLVLSLLGGSSACSGSPLPVSGGATDSGVPIAPLVGSVDLSQAPASLEMSCNRDVGALALTMPCEVGQSWLSEHDKLGVNEVDCHLTTSGHPMVWTFVLAFYQVLQHPDLPVTFPNDPQASPGQSVNFLPPPPGLTTGTEIGGEAFQISNSTGTISFSRIDSPGRAFSGHLKGIFAWTGTTGSTFSCDVDGPFWGSPAGFL